MISISCFTCINTKMHSVRLMKVNDSTIIGGFGDYADFQFIMKLLEQQTIDDNVVGRSFLQNNSEANTSSSSLSALQLFVFQ